MAKFARLFTVDDEQVLLKIDYSEEEESYELSIITEIEGVMCTTKLGYALESRARKTMNLYTLADAEKYIASMRKAFD